MKTIIYTCITGNYDNIIELSKKEKNIEYICFTNNKDLKSNTWNIKYIDENIDNWTLARKVKILSYKYLPNHDISIWIDAAVKIKKSIKDFINNECDLSNYDMVGFKHKYRNCIYDEISACVDLRKETIENANRIESFLKKEKYPHGNGLIETAVLVRKNNNAIKKLMNLWFSMLEKYSRRDQLTLNYCLWKNPTKIKLLDMWVFNNKYFKHMGHQKIKYLNYRIIFDDTNPFDYHNSVDSKTIIDNSKVTIEHKCIKDTNKIVLQMPDEIGSVISNIKINSNSNIKIYNTKYINGEQIFSNDPIVLFEGNFEINQNINIEFYIRQNNLKELVDKLSLKEKNIDKLNDKIGCLKLKLEDSNNKYKILNKSYNDIINSKSWIFIEKIKKLKKEIFRK